MTPQRPTGDPPPPHPRRWLVRRWVVTGLCLGVGLTLAIAGVDYYVRHRLTPRVEQAIHTLINREVVIGAVESYSLRHITFGPSTLPPTPTDPDTVSVESVVVTFNLWRVLTEQTLPLHLTLQQAVAYLEQDADRQWLDLTVTPSTPGRIEFQLQTVTLRQSEVVLVPQPLAATTPPSVPPTLRLLALAGQVDLRDVAEQIGFRGSAQLVQDETKAGQLAVQGTWQRSPQAIHLTLRAQAIDLATVQTVVDLPQVDLTAGLLSGQVQLATQANAAIAIRGTAQVEGVDLHLDPIPQPLRQITGNLRFLGSAVRFETLSLTYGQIPATLNGTLDWVEGYDLTAQLPPFTIAQLLSSLGIAPDRSPIALAGSLDGTIAIQGALTQPRLSGVARAHTPLTVDRLPLDSLATRFTFNGRTVNFTTITAQPDLGGQVTGTGQVELGESGGLVLNLVGTDLPADAIAQRYGWQSERVQIGTIQTQAQIYGPLSQLQAAIAWQAPQATYPGQGEVWIDPRGFIQLQRTQLAVAGGTVRGTAVLNQRDRRWQAVVDSQNVRLDDLAAQLQGTVSGQLRLNGSLDDFSFAASQAEGELTFSNGVATFSRQLASLNQTLQTRLAWDGQQVLVRSAQAEGLQATGTIATLPSDTAIPGLGAFDLQVRAQDYPLTQLPIPQPAGLELAGTTDFTGTITGPLAALRLVGDLTVAQAAVNTVAFEPRLVGTVDLTVGQGLELDIRGDRDQVAVTLDGLNRPRAFTVRQGEALATGTAQGDELAITLTQLNLAALPLPAIPPFGQMSGFLHATFTTNIAARTAAGTVRVAQPAIGHVAVDHLASRFAYQNGALRWEGGELRRGESLVTGEGRLDLGPNPMVQGTLNVVRGDLQDVLLALQFFEVDDLQRGLRSPSWDRAADLDLAPITTAGDRILTQLQRLAAIDVLLAQQRTARQEASPWPDLETLQGNLTGTLELAGSRQTGVRLDFDLAGADWQWDGYDVRRAIITGSLEQGRLRLLPLRLEGNDDILVNFSGQIGGADQAGQLRAENLPVEVLRDFIQLPVSVDGNLNITATLSGRFEDPQVVGAVALVDGMINRSPIQAAQGSFNYTNARLQLGSRLIVLDNPEPLTLQANIPYRLPFMTVYPDSDQIEIRLDVKNEGLALLNLLNQQVDWLDGRGSVQLNVTGTLFNPVAQGIARFDGATFAIAALPDPLTDVSGVIRFDRDRVLVDRLQGNLSQGSVTAIGQIPLFLPDLLPSTPASPETLSSPAANTPLTIALDQLNLNFKGLYSGGVSGKVTVLGTALAPQIGGQIVLSQGQILLPGGETPLPVAAAPPPSSGGLVLMPPQFNNLVLTLGDRVEIRRPPILAFIASGDLTLNGTLQNLRPRGEINLLRGQVNLFTTRFRLAPGPQLAIFRPPFGLDPKLDVRLQTAVTEASRRPFQAATPFTSSEIRESSSAAFGELQTIQIQAAVVGQASQLFDHLRLTSSPTRSETEIVALLGGGFSGDQTGNEGTVAIANLAGSALLGNIQDLVGRAIGLSEFRIFPTTIQSDDDRNSSVELGAEIGIDITQSVSASVVQILTDAAEPTRFNLRYRINDELLLRGSTDFNNDNRLLLEFETRF